MASVFLFFVTLFMDTLSSYSYPSMTCYNDDTFVNEYRGYHDNVKANYFVNGVNSSVHDNSQADRIWKWRYCRHNSSIPFISTSSLPSTALRGTWDRNCSNNSALIGSIGNFDVGTWDRSWVHYCGQLDTNHYILTTCTDTINYVNGGDDPFSFFCHPDGVLTAIFSLFGTGILDRYFGFRCCRITEKEIEPTIYPTTNQSSYPYPLMTCYNDDTFVNEYGGYHDNVKPNYFVNGVNYSEVYNVQDRWYRVWKWRYCRHNLVPFISTSCLAATPFVGTWHRNCSNNSALIGGLGNFDSSQVDRSWVWYCGQLDTNYYILTTCTDTINYVNGLGDAFGFICHPDGVLTGVFSAYGNNFNDRYFGFRCCRVTKKGIEPTIYPTTNQSSYPYPSMTCFNDDTFVNQYRGYHDNFKANYFINGVNYSVHDNAQADRIWKWRYCRHNKVPFISTSSLPATTLGAGNWDRECGNNSALIGGIGNFDVGTWDRLWIWYCGQLDTNHYILTTCTDTINYVNGGDDPFSFICHPDGVLTAVFSVFGPVILDRYFGFRCCRITATFQPTISPTTKEPTIEPTINPTTKQPTIEPTPYPTTNNPTVEPTTTTTKNISDIYQCDPSKFNVTINVHLLNSSSNTINANQQKESIKQLIYNNTLLYLESIGSYSIIKIFCEESIILIYDDDDGYIGDDDEDNLKITLYVTNDGTLDTDNIDDDEYGDIIEKAVEDEYDIDDVDVDVDVNIEEEIIDISTTNYISNKDSLLDISNYNTLIYLIMISIFLILIIVIIVLIIHIYNVCCTCGKNVKYKNMEKEMANNIMKQINSKELITSDGIEMTGINLQKKDTNPVLLDDVDNNDNTTQFQYHQVPISLPKQPVVKSNPTPGAAGYNDDESSD